MISHFRYSRGNLSSFIIVLYKWDPTPPGERRTPPAWQEENCRLENEEKRRGNGWAADGVELQHEEECVWSWGKCQQQGALPTSLLGTPEEEALHTGHHKWPCLCKPSFMTVPSKTPRTPACLVEAKGRVLHSEPVAATGGWAGAAWPCSKVYKGVQGSGMRGRCRGSLRCSSQCGSRSKGQWQRPSGTRPGTRSRPALIPPTVVRNRHQQCLMGTNPGSRGATLQKRPARLRGSTRTSHTPSPNPRCQLKASGAGMRCSKDAASAWVIQGEAGKLLELLPNAVLLSPATQCCCAGVVKEEINVLFTR